ncbi:MAG: methyl-accepting chemotaxis protein [Gallionellaceae bacterium]|nr:MAG: methyl-accepting chemotaxis protein [Gallionellaceae bacterium]
MFTNMSLKNKFLALESVSFTMLLATVVFGLIVLHSAMENEVDNIQRLKQDIEVMGEIDTLNIVVVKEAKIAKDVWIRGSDQAKVDKYRDEFIQNVERFQSTHEAALAGLNKLAQGHAGFDGFIQKLELINNEHASVSWKYLAQIEAHKGNTLDSDAEVAGIDRELTKQIKELRDDFVQFVDQKGAEKIKLAQEDYASHRNMVVVWLVFSLSLSLLVATLIIRQIMRQLGGDPKEVAVIVNTMAGGDFSQQPNKLPEPGSLLANAYQMQSKLRDMIASVKGQAAQVGDMAHSLATSANQIAENVNHESDAVSSMAAAIEELSVSTTHISNQGANAKRIANSSRSNAEAGAQVVNKTVNGLLSSAQEIQGASAEVSRLGEDASRISEIVKVIKEIADQTNLLALNAAIEAARAGEQGRGFAVVADEVRKLAERTAGATNEINQMSSKIGAVANHALSGMDKVVKTTQQGVGDAETAQTSIKHIQENFGEVSGVIDDIALALGEQNAAATELAKSTERVSQMSEENSNAAQSLLSLANDLESKAREVRQSVDVFKV